MRQADKTIFVLVQREAPARRAAAYCVALPDARAN